MFEHARAGLRGRRADPVRGVQLRAGGTSRAAQPALLGAGAVPGRGRLGGVLPPARRRDGLAIFQPPRDGRLPAPGGGAGRGAPPPGTSSGAPRPIWRTRRSGWGCAPATASTARRTRGDTGAIRLAGREAAVAAAVDAGWLVVDDARVAPDAGRRAVRRRDRRATLEIAWRQPVRATACSASAGASGMAASTLVASCPDRCETSANVCSDRCRPSMSTRVTAATGQSTLR